MQRDRHDQPDRSHFHDVVAAWAVVLVAALAGLAANWDRAPQGSERLLLPRWYDPSVAAAGAWEEDETSGRPAVDIVMPRPGDGDTSTLSICERAPGARPPKLVPAPVAAGSDAELAC
jgi:hypothetical protein